MHGAVWFNSRRLHQLFGSKAAKKLPSEASAKEGRPRTNNAPPHPHTLHPLIQPSAKELPSDQHLIITRGNHHYHRTQKHIA